MEEEQFKELCKAVKQAIAHAKATPPIVDYGGGQWCPVCGKAATGRGYCVSCGIEWSIKEMDPDLE